MTTNKVRAAIWRASVSLCAAVVLGCSDGTGPEAGRRTTDLHFLRPAPGAPSLANPVVSFYAKVGEERSVSIVYHARAGEADSVEFLHFRVPATGLARRPDGSGFSPGDSIRIQITIVDPLRLIARFEPAGLQFSASAPAELAISYEEADPDFDGDGDIDAEDFEVEGQLRIWRQPTSGALWHPLRSTLFGTINEIEGDVLGFSNYAVAF